MLFKNRKRIARRYFAFIPIFILSMGFASITCSPPEYYDPELGAPYVAETVTISTQAGYVLMGREP